MNLQTYIDMNEEATTHVVVVDKDGASALLPISFEQKQQMRAIWRERWNTQPGFRVNQFNMQDGHKKRLERRWSEHEYSQTPHAIRQRELKAMKKAAGAR